MVARTIPLTAFLIVSGLCLAQRGSFDDSDRSSRRGRSYVAPEIVHDRNGVPTWDRDPLYPDDDFTYVRLLYGGGGSYGGRYGRDKWATDWPDSDLNLSFRLQQLTALKVNPDPIILEATDPRLVDYPWLYVIEPGGERYGAGGMNLTPEEAEALRRYAFNGGFIMVDDFWGEDEWDNFYVDFKKIFPDREPVDLELDHEVFHNVYDLKVKPQVPSINHWERGHRYETPDSAEVHYRGVHDDEGRIMMLICHNTDLGDGWEREGEDPGYFRDHSEPSAYPMGINILFYAMTH